MKKQNVNKIILKKETVLQSIVSDFFSMITLGGLFWFNYQFIGGSYFVNFVILVLFLVISIKYAGNDRVNQYRVSQKHFEQIKNFLELHGKK